MNKKKKNKQNTRKKSFDQFIVEPTKNQTRSEVGALSQKEMKWILFYFYDGQVDYNWNAIASRYIHKIHTHL